jgi:hypothetical protein
MKKKRGRIIARNTKIERRSVNKPMETGEREKRIVKKQVLTHSVRR